MSADPFAGGRPKIGRCVLNDGDVSVAILSLGCITQDWQVPANGARLPAVLGYANPQDYLSNPYYLGAIVGRVANRISGAAFDLGGQRYTLDRNDGPHHLHGGAGGLGHQNWAMDPDGDRAVQLCHVSPDGAAGYPGRAEFEVRISLDGFRLRYDMRAAVDRPTPINLAQHSYYSLGAHGTVRDHELRLPATHYTPVDAAMIPTGKIRPVTGEAFDFRDGRRLADADPQGRGLDMNFVTPGGAEIGLSAPNGLHLHMRSDQPGVQLFTAPGLAQLAPPLAGQRHVPFGALCLEPQGLPDALNQPGFPSIIATPDKPYHQILDVTIAWRAAT